MEARSSGGTNLGVALSVVAFTKSMIACFAAPSFHGGSGSVAEAASARAETERGGGDRIANDDVGLEAVGAQVAQHFLHRLVGEVGIVNYTTRRRRMAGHQHEERLEAHLRVRNGALIG